MRAARTDRLDDIFALGHAPCLARRARAHRVPLVNHELTQCLACDGGRTCARCRRNVHALVFELEQDRRHVVEKREFLSAAVHDLVQCIILALQRRIDVRIDPVWPQRVVQVEYDRLGKRRAGHRRPRYPDLSTLRRR